MTRFKQRPSPALVISMIALFVALGSGAYAASKIDTKDIKKKAVTTPKIDGKAVSSQKIAGKAVTASKVARDSIKSTKIQDESLKTDDYGPETVTGSKLADGGVTLEKLDSSSVAEGFQSRSDLIYASVSGGSLVDENSRGATNATSTGVGQYTVTFERDVSGCAWFPSRSAIGTGIPANGDFLGVGGQTGEPNNVRVRVRDSNNNLANRSFSLLVVC